MSAITFISKSGNTYMKQVVDQKGSRIIEFDEDGNETIISECKN